MGHEQPGLDLGREELSAQRRWSLMGLLAAVARRAKTARLEQLDDAVRHRALGQPPPELRKPFLERSLHDLFTPQHRRDPA